MTNFDIQFFFNCGPFIYIMVRYADHLASLAGRPKLIGFLLVSFVGNAVLMLDRFSLAEAIWRGAGNALLLAAGVFLLRLTAVAGNTGKSARSRSPRRIHPSPRQAWMPDLIGELLAALHDTEVLPAARTARWCPCSTPAGMAR